MALRICKTSCGKDSSKLRVSLVTLWIDHLEWIDDYKFLARGCDEIIVVDNGSTPENAAKIEKMVDDLGGIYVRNKENIGFSAGNNLGASYATGDIIVFTNNDIRSSKPIIDFIKTDVTEDNVLYGASLTSRPIEGITIPYIDGYFVAATRKTWEKLEWWDAENFPLIYFEDLDLSFRAKAWYNMQLKPCVHWNIFHAGGTTTSTDKNKYFRDFATNQKVVADRVKTEIAKRKKQG